LVCCLRGAIVLAVFSPPLSEMREREREGGREEGGGAGGESE
jgi:hypothetical protein